MEIWLVRDGNDYIAAAFSTEASAQEYVRKFSETVPSYAGEVDYYSVPIDNPDPIVRRSWAVESDAMHEARMILERAAHPGRYVSTSSTGSAIPSLIDAARGV